MNRSWFRLPFGGSGNTSSSSHLGHDAGHDGIAASLHDEEDETDLAHDSGEVIPASRPRLLGSTGNRRSKTSNGSNSGKRNGVSIKQSISRPFPSPLASASDTASYATAQASSALSASTAGSSSGQTMEIAGPSGDHVSMSRASTNDTSRQVEHAQHAYRPSLQSISSIRTAHFSARADFDRMQRSTTPDGSMEVSPSKTPLRDRLNRLSVVSVASGMVSFGDDDREEAERRWLEDDLEEETAEQLERDRGINIDNQHSDVSESEYENNNAPKMTPSRSSTSIKSILKKSTASIEILAIAAGSAHATPRTVTWSPSTAPPAKSPPPTDVSPEHPRGPLAAAEAYLLNLSQRQQDGYYRAPRQLTDHSSSSTSGSDAGEDSSDEVEEALLSRSSNGISPHNLSSASLPESANESSDSLRQQGSASKRGAAFMDRMQGLIPSPDSSFADTKYAPDDRNKHDPSISNILDMSAPSQSVLNDLTVNDDRSRLQNARPTGPKPFLLRQSVILEEPSILESSIRSQQAETALSPRKPNSSLASSMQAGQSSITAPLAPLFAGGALTPVQHELPSYDLSYTRSDSNTPATKQVTKQASAADDDDESLLSHEAFQTPLEGADQITHEVAGAEEPDQEEEGSLNIVEQASPSPSLRVMPSVTPSSSSSSLVKIKPESPFTSLVNHLLSTQDELLSHRADQKTMLISLVSNLRAELASRDRSLDTLEAQKKSLQRSLRKEKEDRDKDRLTQRDRIATAMAEVEVVKEKLAAEVKRRDDALREELLHERAKREMAEKQIESLLRKDSSSEEVDFLQQQLQLLRHAADEADMNAERSKSETNQISLQLENALREKEMLEQRLEASERAQDDARGQADALADECSKLRKNAMTSEKQLAKATTNFEHQSGNMRNRLTSADAQISRLTRQLDDTMHALQDERAEQTKQYDLNASLQESLRIDNDRLNTSIARLEKTKDHSFQQLQIFKKDTTTVLAQKDQRIKELEAELSKRYSDRRTQQSSSSPSRNKQGESEDSTSASRNTVERTQFLESEIVRLREVVSKMRMESADREVKVARLVKAREQLKDDIDGLNIALEAKQQEVLLLKREVHRHSGEQGTTNVQTGIASSHKHIGRTITSASSRRPSSLHDANSAAASSTFAAEQKRRSLRSKSSHTGKGISIHRSRASIDGPTPVGVLSSLSSNHTNSNILNSAVTGVSSSMLKQTDSNSDRDKALEAASLVKAVVNKVATTNDKENLKSTQIRNLPAAPAHPLPTGSPSTHASQMNQTARPRSNSSILMTAR